MIKKNEMENSTNKFRNNYIYVFVFLCLCTICIFQGVINLNLLIQKREWRDN